MTDNSSAPVITITASALEQIRLSAQQGGMERLALRIAATRQDDNSIKYAMGFDESSMEDELIRLGGVTVVIAPRQKDLLQGTVLDYVELEPDDFKFIFMNPNDPNYVPPSE
jgi:iron-sulfur cluster assembly protein